MMKFGKYRTDGYETAFNCDKCNKPILKKHMTDNRIMGAVRCPHCDKMIYLKHKFNKSF